jgi:hypothetical protein
VIAGARQKFTDREAKLVEEYLDQGGRLIFFAEAMAEAGLDEVLAKYGVKIEPGILADERINIPTASASRNSWPRSTRPDPARASAHAARDEHALDAGEVLLELGLEPRGARQVDRARRLPEPELEKDLAGGERVLVARRMR